MNLISKFMAIFSIVFVIILSTDGYYLKYTFSEPFSNQYSTYVDSNSYKPNQTSLNTGCDFLNLCGNYVGSKLSGVFLPATTNIIDISYLDSYLELPFP